MIVLLALLGCSGDCPDGSTLDPSDGLCHLDGAVDSGSSNGGGDDGGSDVAPAEDISAEVSEAVHTVVTVRWTTAEDVQGYVEFGETEAYGMRSPLTDAGTAHEALMLGLWADTEFHFRVVSVGEDGREAPSGDYTVTTGSLPVEIPTMTISGEAGWEGFLFAPFEGIHFLALALDPQGRVVWYKVLDSDEHHVMRAEPMYGGAGVAICMAGQQNKEEGYVLLVSMDGTEETVIDAPFIDHDMIVLPDNSIGGIVIQRSDEYDGEADSIQEISASGSMTQVFSAWDHVDTLPSEPPPARGEGGGGGPESNWTHANALDYDPGSGSYYMAMKELHTTARVDRETGTMLWAFGGQGNQFSFAEGTEPLSMHHQLHVYDDRFLVFENGEPGRGYSMVREFTLDTDSMVAEEVWSYVREPSVYVFAKGDVERLSNGNTLVTWSSSGEIQEVTPAGDVSWQVNAALGSAITFVSRVESLYAR